MREGGKTDFIEASAEVIQDNKDIRKRPFHKTTSPHASTPVKCDERKETMRLDSKEKLLSWGHHTLKNSKTPTYVTTHDGDSHSKRPTGSSKEIYLISNVLARAPHFLSDLGQETASIFGNSMWK